MALAFALELAMLASIGRWGFLQGKTTLSKYLIAIVLVLAAATLWGILAAPRSGQRLPLMPRLVFELGMFLLAAFLLHLSRHTTLAVWFAVLACVSVGLAFILKQ